MTVAEFGASCLRAVGGHVVSLGGRYVRWRRR